MYTRREKMKISPILNSKISFKSSERSTFRNSKGYLATDSRTVNPADELVNSNITTFFRGDLTDNSDSWIEFRKALVLGFSGIDCVHTYDFACSDGSEAYSLILSLIDEIGDEGAMKFFPVMAYDIDTGILECAKTSKIPCDKNDIDSFKKNFKNIDPKKYFSISPNGRRIFPYDFIPSKDLASKVEFRYGDITKSIDLIEPSYSLVLCRNFSRYLSFQDAYNTILKLAKRLDSTSLIVLGKMEEEYAKNLLFSFGYKEMSKLVYRKISNPSDIYQYRMR